MVVVAGHLYPIAKENGSPIIIGYTLPILKEPYCCYEAWGSGIEVTSKSGPSPVVSPAAATVQAFKEHRKRQNADRLAAGKEWKGADNKDNDHVFTAAWGEPIHPDTVSSLMASVIARHNKVNSAATLPPARRHDLRHIHATTLLLAGVPVDVVAARLGHADPSITLRVYAHVINEQLVEAADIFAKQITAAQEGRCKQTL